MKNTSNNLIFRYYSDNDNDVIEKLSNEPSTESQSDTQPTTLNEAANDDAALLAAKQRETLAPRRSPRYQNTATSSNSTSSM
jgi:hypothetical protein